MCFRKTQIPSTSTIDQLLQFQMNLFEKMTKQKLDSNIHKKTTNEVVYSYVGPVLVPPALKERVTLSHLIRVVSIYGELYSFMYRSNRKMTDQKILEWQKKLEGIRVITKPSESTNKKILKTG